jgi:uncharacterized membrane protein
MNQSDISAGFRARVVYGLLLAIAISWFLATLLPAYLAASGDLFWAALARYCFSPICHQMPERSFLLWGKPLAVCARCSGIYFGVIIGLLIYPWTRDCACPDTPARGYLLLAIAPTTIDFFVGFFHILTNTHLSRSLTGAIAGGGLAFYLMPVAVSLAEDLARLYRAKIRGVFQWRHQAR